MTDVVSRLIVSLLDRVTAPARGIAASIKSVGDAAKRLQAVTGITSFTNGVNAALERSRSRLQAYRASLLEVVGTAYMLGQAFKAPTAAATEWESKILDIGQKVGMARDAQVALGETVRKMAGPLAQRPTAMLGGVDFLTGNGMDPDTAVKSMFPIGKTATAFRAQIEDLARASFASIDNLKVPVEELEAALDAMASAGNNGGFEIKDMAAHFPSLTAAADALGLRGVDGVSKLAAALQIARKGAGDGAQAATNTANLMQKIVSPETTKKFAKQGIDIRKELKKTQAAGGDVFEMIARLVQKATKGDMAKLGDLFEDAEVQKFLRPLVANIEEYKKIRDQAMKARGEVEKNFQERMKTAAAAQMQLAAATENFSITMGNVLLPAVTAVVNRLDAFVQRLDAIAKANPELVRNLALAVGGLVAFRIAAFAAGFAATSLKVATLAAAAAIGRVAQVASFVAAAGFLPFKRAAVGLLGVMQIMALRFRMGAAAMAAGGGALAFLSGTFATLTRAAFGVVGVVSRLAGSLLLVSGAGALVVAAVLAISAGFAWLWNNMKGIGTFLGAFGTAFVAALGPVKGAIMPVVDAAGRLYDKVASWLGPIDESGKKWAEWGTAAGQAVAGWVNGTAAFVSNTIDAIASIPARVAALAKDMYAAGVALITALWDGLKAQIDAMIAWFSAKISELSARASALAHSMSFGLVGSAPAPAGGGGGAPAPGSPGQARALGGNVDAGRSYWVGEKGREIFTPGRSGSIAPNGAGGGASLAPAVTLNMSMTFNGRTDDPQEIARTVRDTMRSEVREALRGVFADTGVRYA